VSFPETPVSNYQPAAYHLGREKASNETLLSGGRKAINTAIPGGTVPKGRDVNIFLKNYFLPEHIFWIIEPGTVNFNV
jgi:hypothetical protein